MNSDNLMVLLRAFNNSPTVPITVDSVLATTTTHHDSFEWLSAEEVEYKRLSAQIGPTTTELIIRLLGRHGLVNTPGTDLFNNFNQVVRYYLSQGWQISAESFERVIGNLRTSRSHGALVYKPTPTQLERQNRGNETRKSESTKTAKRIAEEKAATVRHVMTPDGRRLSDVIMQEYYDTHPEETPVTPTPAHISDSDGAYWQKRVTDFLNWIPENNLNLEARQKFSTPEMGVGWQRHYARLSNWYDQHKSAFGK